MGSAVSSRHPSEELSVVDDEVGECELMGIEEEWGNTKTKDGDPEVDDMGDPDGHGDVEQEDQCSHTEVDRRAGESGAEESASSSSIRMKELTKESRTKFG
jgi:hypothetical protein